MSAVRVRLDPPGGVPEELDVDLDLGTLTMRESVRLEAVLGEELFNRLISSGLTPEAATSPKIVQGVLYVKLKTLRPDIELDAFDLDLEELADALGVEEDNPKVAEPSGDGSSL